MGFWDKGNTEGSNSSFGVSDQDPDSFPFFPIKKGSKPILEERIWSNQGAKAISKKPQNNNRKKVGVSI